MVHVNRLAITRLVAGLVAGMLMISPAGALDYEQLMKLKQQFEVVRDLVRKLRGREKAPTPPTPPSPTQTPAPEGTPAPAVGGMSFTGSCVAKDETGYAENAQLTIADGKVSQLTVRIDVPKRGSCRYQLAAFKQTKTSPFVEMVANSNASCALRMWQQGDRVTFTATECADKCAPGAFDYAWPVEFQTAGGCH
jgi:hypothetical protein